MGFGVQGSEFRVQVQSSGLRVQGSGLRAQGSGLRVQVSGFRVQGSGFRAQGSGLRVQGSEFRVQGSGFRAQGSGLRVQGSGFRVQGGKAGEAFTQLLETAPCLRPGRDAFHFTLPARTECVRHATCLRLEHILLHTFHTEGARKVLVKPGLLWRRCIAVTSVSASTPGIRVVRDQMCTTEDPKI